MSRIDELINRLCPSGVEYKKLGDILCKVSGAGSGLKRNLIMKTGAHPVYTQSTVDSPDGYTDKSENLINDLPVILYGDHTNAIKWIDEPFVIGADGVKLVKTNQLNNRFLFHILKSKIHEIPNGYARHFAKLRQLDIPLPPLEVQSEIVRILDNFTELTAELTAELASRKKQYEYFRDRLLTFDDNHPMYEMVNQLCPDGVEYKQLKNISEMKRGTSATKRNLSIGDIPVVSGGKDPAFYCNISNRIGETITVAGSGAGAGYVKYWNCPIYVNDAFSVKGMAGVLTKYLFYCLTNDQEKIYATKTGGGIPHVHISNIENFLIPLPPVEVQSEIVRILDYFNSLCNDISVGLPAEIKSRKKQYEFYRDKLLAFDELKAA